MSTGNSADVIGRDPLTDPLLAELRTVLDQVEAAPDGWPSTMPPWEQISASMGRTRRARRVRRTRQVLGGAVAVTLVCGAAAVGVLPYPSFAPSFQVPSSGHSALYGQPVRGSLKADEAWLSAFRLHVSKDSTDFGDGWHPPAAADVRVLFAGDVGSTRIALAEGDWHLGARTEAQQVWYAGAAGASAAKLDVRSLGDPADGVATQVVLPTTGDQAAVVVVSADGVDVQLQGAPSIDARARVSPHPRIPVPSREPGLYTAAVTRSGSYRVLVDRKPVGEPFELGDDGAPRPFQATWQPARGGAGVMLYGAGDNIWHATLQPSGTGTFQLLVGPDSSQGQKLAVRPTVELVTLPSGAHVLGLGGIFDGDESASGFDAATLVKAGPVSELAVAWRTTPAEFHDRPTWTAAMGPVGTSTVEWVHADGTVSSSPARYTLAVIVADDVRSVRFLGAGGAVLATRQVLLKPTGFGVIPQVEAAVGR